jgi:hypothetical protein
MEDGMARRAATDTVNLRLRLPEALRQKLEAEAEEAGRSMNSEILWRLGQTFSEQWQRFIAGVEERERKAEEIGKRLAESPEVQKIISDLIAKHEGKG